MLRIVTGDITTVAVDAMVNAANSGLAGGGGVDGAIHRAGGPSIMKELDRILAAQGRCPAGSAVATGAGRLPAKYVFHTVGPVYRGGAQGEAKLLAECYDACFDLAGERAIQSLSFPAISTGAYGYPIQEAAAIAVGAISRHLERAEISVREVIVVLFDTAAYEAFERVLLE